MLRYPEYDGVGIGTVSFGLVAFGITENLSFSGAALTKAKSADINNFLNIFIIDKI